MAATVGNEALAIIEGTVALYKNLKAFSPIYYGDAVETKVGVVTTER